jgi:16S rRNA processing protein RimM
MMNGWSGTMHPQATCSRPANATLSAPAAGAAIDALRQPAECGNDDMTEGKRILIGHISALHGIRGEVVLVSHAATPEDIAAYGPLSDEAGTRSFTIESVRVAGKGLIARIRGVGDRNAAEALKGTQLFVARAQMPEPEDEEFYHADLVGLAAQAPDGTVLGRVLAVQNFGAGDILEIAPADGAQTLLVPFDRTHVPVIDIAGGRVVAVLPDAGDDDDEPEGR